MVTHAELTPGYQIAQIAHATANFALYAPEEFAQWHKNSQYIVALETDNPQALNVLHDEISSPLKALPFTEPDLGNALTSIAFIPHEMNRRYLANLRLAGSRNGRIDKHSKEYYSGTNNKNKTFKGTKS